MLDCDARRRLHWRLAVGRWSVTLMVPHMVHLQDVVKLHTLCWVILGSYFCHVLDLIFALLQWILIWGVIQFGARAWASVWAREGGALGPMGTM